LPHQREHRLICAWRVERPFRINERHAGEFIAIPDYSEFAHRADCVGADAHRKIESGGVGELVVTCVSAGIHFFCNRAYKIFFLVASRLRGHGYLGLKSRTSFASVTPITVKNRTAVTAF
jgi:hypothetical protein